MQTKFAIQDGVYLKLDGDFVFVNTFAEVVTVTFRINFKEKHVSDFGPYDFPELEHASFLLGRCEYLGEL